jgi:hypothetical protein
MAVKTISQDQLDNFSVDEETSQLYWRGNQVVTVISLPWWVQVSALASGLGTAAGAIIAAISLIHSWH